MAMLTYDNALARAEIVECDHQAPALPVHQAEGEGHRLLREHAEDHPTQDHPLLIQPRLLSLQYLANCQIFLEAKDSRKSVEICQKYEEKWLTFF
jgi:hypothetical protein